MVHRWRSVMAALLGAALFAIPTVWGAGPVALAASPTVTTIRVTGSTPTFATVVFPTTRTGYLGGSGTILATHDGGRQWTLSWRGAGTVADIDPAAARHVYAVTNDEFIGQDALADAWQVLREPDGTTTCRAAPSSPCITSVSFGTGTTGYAVAVRPAVVGTNPAAVAVSPNGAILYVANGSGTVSAYSRIDHRILWSVAVGVAPGGLGVSPNGRYLYVTDQNSNAVTTINTVTHRAAATTKTVANPCAIAVNSTTGTFYVASASAGLEELSGGRSPRVIAHLAGNAGSCGLAWGAGHTLYTAEDTGPGGAVDVYDTATNRLTHQFALPTSATGVVVSPTGRTLFVSTIGTGADSQVLELNASSGRTLRAWAVPSLAWSIAADWTTGTVYTVTGTDVSEILVHAPTPTVVTRPLANNAIMGSSVALSTGTLYVPVTAGIAAVSRTGRIRVLPTSGVATTDALGIPIPAIPGPVYATQNGGTSWSRLAHAPRLQSLCALGNGTVLGAAGSTVWSSSNQGSSWHIVFRAPVQPAPGLSPALECQGEHAALEITGWGAAMGHVAYIAFQSVDGGGEWTPAIEENYTHPGLRGVTAPEGPGSYPGPFTWTDSGTAMWSGWTPAVPGSGVGYRVGKGLSTVAVPGGQALISMAFPSRNEGYVLTSQNRLVATDNGGLTWRQVYPTTLTPLLAVSFVTADAGFGLGSAGDPTLVLKTTDGGTQWTPVGSVPVAGLMGSDAFDFISPDDGFAVSTDQALWRTTDGGHRWVDTHLTADGVAFAGRDGCLAQNQGYRTTTNGGASWTTHAATLPNSLLACAAELAHPALRTAVSAMGDNFLVGAVGPDDFWFTLPDGWSVAATENGGATWTDRLPDRLAASLQVNCWDFVTASTAYVVTTLGTLYRSHDGGADWTLIS